MIPDVGTTCKYYLSTKFNLLNGVYTLNSVASFETRLANGVNFTNSLYLPAGLSSTDYATDVNNYRGENVLELASVTDSTVTIYVPVSLLANTPDPTVKRYRQLVLNAILGPMADEASYLWASNEITDTLQNVFGVDAQVIWTTASAKNDQWLTSSEYTTLEQTRAADRKALNTKSAQIESLTTQVTTMAATIRALQAIIAAKSS